ncbi:MAG: amino acid permease [Gemmatimonadota bacterium]|nr:MAG: amino acid permease [Gemmatimonadota bacterium]
MTQGSPDGKIGAELVRQLGTFDSIMMMVGIVIGSGIFLTTGIMAQSIPSAGLLLLAWLVGGVLTLTGALTFAELGAALPHAGGQYVYLREAYGHLSGFLFGWILFLVSMGGSIAALGVGFAEYVGYFFPALSTQRFIFSAELDFLGAGRTYALSVGQLVGVGVIVLLSAFNYVGVAFGKLIQNVFTVVKIGAILAFIVLGFTIGTTVPIDFTVNPTSLSTGQLFFGFGVAIIAVSWAFDGWHNVTYIAGEIENPKRNLPVALVAGTLIITSLYVLVNVVYLLALPVPDMVGVVRIAERAATALHGDVAAALISAAVIVSTFGALNGAIFVAPRVYYAMARDGIFFRKVGEVHPRFCTPAFAILLQAVWASLLTLTGSYEQLFTYVVFISFIFWMAAAAAVFVLRRTRPDLPRPYKTWGYPVVPLVFIVSMGTILINTLIARPVESLAGLGITILGVPVYYHWRRRSRLSEGESETSSHVEK